MSVQIFLQLVEDQTVSQRRERKDPRILFSAARHKLLYVGGESVCAVTHLALDIVYLFPKLISKDTHTHPVDAPATTRFYVKQIGLLQPCRGKKIP